MTVSYREALDLVDQLQLDIGTRLSMSMAGWKHPMSRQELYTAGLLARVMNVTRGEDEQHFTPDWPWPDETEEAPVSDEERAALTARLNATSAFGQLRTGGLADV